MANTLNKVNSGGIEDGSIVNADVKSDAAIAGSKLAAATTSAAGSMSAADKTKLDGVATSATANPSAPALTGSTNNTVCTVTGANAIQGEANLTCDGDYLFIGGATASDAVNGAQNFIIKDTSSDGGMSFLSGTSGLGQIHFSDTDANGQGRVVYNHNGDSLGLHTAGSERLRVDSGGRLLIGTTTNSGTSSSADDIVIGSIGDSTSRGITFATTADATIRWADAGDNAMGRIQYLNNTDIMSFHTANAERLRIDADGLKFNGDTAAANGLSDYEEGTWTPAVHNGVTNTQTFDANGRYTKIGRTVHCQFLLQWSGANTGSGTDIVEFSGLPFTSLNATALGGGTVTWSNIPGLMNYDSIEIIVKTNSQIIQLYQGMNSNAVTGSQSWTNKSVYGVFTYEAA